MWPGPDRGSRTVTCIACGADVARSEAREYDKHGDRWEREGKQFEYLCKTCFRHLSNEPRDGQEDLLVAVGAGTVSRAEFLDRYLDAITDDEDGVDRGSDGDAESGGRHH